MLRFSFKTIERWYYAARGETDPIAVLERKVPKHAGTHPSIGEALATAAAKQHRDHPRWSYQLHYDNLIALARTDPTIGKVPGYSAIRRYMQDNGLARVKRRPRRRDDDFVPRELRSYEVEHVHGLWHLDFHEGSRSVVTPSGELSKPQLLGILDDRSRLCCHLQWYLGEECAEFLIHGLSQAFHKRGLPRALLTDNGAAMLAAETTEGLERLGIVHHTTLPATPEQNGKQESFWGQVEGRLLPMLEGEPILTIELLNTATQAWVEHEYQRKEHSEIGETPLSRYLRGPSVGRDSPSSDALRRAFRTEVTRTQRKSDGTVTVEGVRFEVPSAYRTLRLLRLRVARWDLSSVDLVDPRTGAHLATLQPLDKARRADGIRRALEASTTERQSRQPPGIAPHLRALMAEYAATGLPPGFVPQRELQPADDNFDTDHHATPTPEDR
jgi:transposase InsO family protein